MISTVPGNVTSTKTFATPPPATGGRSSSLQPSLQPRGNGGEEVCSGHQHAPSIFIFMDIMVVVVVVRVVVMVVFAAVFVMVEMVLVMVVCVRHELECSGC